MMMLPPVKTVLKASSPVRAIIGTSPLPIYRHGRAPQRSPTDPLTPYIVWFLVVGTPENTLSELPRVDRMQVQIDLYHPTDSGIEELAIAARDACEPFAVMTAIIDNRREQETKLFHLALQFDWFVDRDDD